MKWGATVSLRGSNPMTSMSARGHERRFRSTSDTSGLPLTPDQSLHCRERSKRAIRDQNASQQNRRSSRSYVEPGPSCRSGRAFRTLFHRSAAYVDRILRGARAGDLPVEQPTRFEFVVNVTTAKLPGLDVSPRVLDMADEVVD